jgi:hypothetical protein
MPSLKEEIQMIKLKDLITPNISVCRKIDNVLLINVLFVSRTNYN